MPGQFVMATNTGSVSNRRRDAQGHACKGQGVPDRAHRRLRLERRRLVSNVILMPARHASPSTSARDLLVITSHLAFCVAGVGLLAIIGTVTAATAADSVRLQG